MNAKSSKKMSITSKNKQALSAAAESTSAQLSFPVRQPDGEQTMVHLAVLPRPQFRLRVGLMPVAEPLLHWCRRQRIRHAMSGGYFLRSAKTPLGETWMNGLKIQSLPFGAHWAKKRGALFACDEELRIAPLGQMPGEPRGDLLTAGPTLVRNSRKVVHPEAEFEGIPETWQNELDDDWTQWRAARTTIGYDAERVWAVVCDGPLTDPVFRKQVGADDAPNAGLYLWEMAEIMIALGATDALNLDGGGGSTLIYDQRLINKPLAGKYDDQPPGSLLQEGRAIHTAISFIPR